MSKKNIKLTQLHQASLLIALGFWALFWPSQTFCQTVASRFKVNPSYKEIELRSLGSSGFLWTGVKDDVEISVRGTRAVSALAAKDLSKVDFENVWRLYDERGNPYEGQISQLVVCDKKLKPKSINLTFAGQSWRGLLGGATDRKQLGACDGAQVAYWSEYFNFIDEASNYVFSVRLFRRLQAPTSQYIVKAEAQLTKLAKTVMIQVQP